ncbi:hypothetical protein LRS10_21445, partial [Phenylobacterium sp. J426]|uniref:hypothetical protein n=1 Tax=Phenylobacterium sp. J426 TaxID=2898439 RepID=UPI0021516851
MTTTSCTSEAGAACAAAPFAEAASAAKDTPARIIPRIDVSLMLSRHAARCSASMFCVMELCV